MNETAPRVCLIEDDEIMGQALSDRLQIEGFECDWWRDGQSGLRAIGVTQYAVAVCDVRLPDVSGDELFARLQESGSEVPPFVFVTGYGTVDVAVRLLKLGARDYLTKPLDIQALLRTLRLICTEAGATRSETGLGVSASMRAIAGMLPRLAQNAGTVLITGESGVGKEEVARALHRAADPDAKRPFVAVNCGALTETLLEAELFGYVKGAFTGAVRDRKGVFELADGGTLFLDEVGDMSAAMQVRLLRVLQDREVRRIGGERAVSVSLRLVCATHQDLRRLVETGAFREDLYYRIHVIHLQVPPLRDRKEDILWLAHRLLERWAQEHDDRRTLHRSAEQALLGYGWPGNVRELKHCLERACILSRSPVLSAGHLFDDQRSVPIDDGEAGLPLASYLEQCERQHIRRSLQANGGRIAATADALGISRKNLWEKMKKLGVEP